MIRSMTGYGRAEVETQMGRWVVEVKSVNHRFLDVKSKLPQELFSLDIECAKRVQEMFARGRFEILVSRRIAGSTVGINRQAVLHYLEELRSLRHDFDIEGQITLDTVMGLPDVVSEQISPQADLQSVLLATLGDALNALAEMRVREGAAIGADLEARVEGMLGAMREIEVKVPRLNAALRDRLAARLGELLEGAQVDSQRLEQEIAFLAERSDVTEELVRLGIHARQFLAYLRDEAAVGRKMDFLLQEMNREVNTLGSKIGDAEVAQKVVELKSELEKIREQTQNVE